jgi:hypothetical protein
MKRIFGSLLIFSTFLFATPVSRVALATSLCLGLLLWKQCLKTVSAEKKLRPIRVPVSKRKK